MRIIKGHNNITKIYIYRNFNANSRNFSIFFLPLHLLPLLRRPLLGFASSLVVQPAPHEELQTNTTATEWGSKQTHKRKIYQVISLKYINMNKIAKSFLLEIFPNLFGNSFKNRTNGTFQGWAVCVWVQATMMMMKSCCWLIWLSLRLLLLSSGFRDEFLLMKTDKMRKD